MERMRVLIVDDDPEIRTMLSRALRVYSARWADVDEPDPREDTVRLQAHAKGAAVFRRTEGLWLAGDELYITATTGGPIGRGQIFRLHRGASADAELELLAQTVDPDVLDMPDNITVSPHGHVYVAEDGLDGNFIRRVMPDGRVLPFAHNALSLSEFAGLCFSPDGSTLFANIQHNGLTLAIRGPFEQAADGVTASARLQSRSRGSAGLVGLGAGLAVIALAALAKRRLAPISQR